MSVIEHKTMKKMINVFGKIGLFILILFLAYISYNFVGFYQLQRQNLNRIETRGVEVTLLLDESLKNSDVDLFESKLREIKDIKTVNTKSSEQAKANYIEANKDDKILIEALEDTGENPFSGSIKISFAPEKSDAVATEVKRIIKEIEITKKTNLLKKIDLDSRIANSKDSFIRKTGITLTNFVIYLSIKFLLNSRNYMLDLNSRNY